MSREKSQLWSGIAGSGPVRFRRRGWGGLHRPSSPSRTGLT